MTDQFVKDIDAAIDTAMADSESNQQSICSRVKDLGDEWGTKFISINNNSFL